MPTETQRLTRTDLSGTSYLRICDVVGANPLHVSGLPSSVAAIERAVRDAIKAERKGDPMPDLPSWKLSFERELRMILKKAFGRLRLFDVEIERLSSDRDALALTLKG